MQLNNFTQPKTTQPGLRLVAQSKQETVSDTVQQFLLIQEYEQEKDRVRAHEVPSTCLPALRKRVIESMRAGQSTKQCAKQNNVTQDLAQELFFRAELAKIYGQLADIRDALRLRPQGPNAAGLRRIA